MLRQRAAKPGCQIASDNITPSNLAVAGCEGQFPSKPDDTTGESLEGSRRGDPLTVARVADQLFPIMAFQCCWRPHTCCRPRCSTNGSRQRHRSPVTRRGGNELIGPVRKVAVKVWLEGRRPRPY